MSRIEADVKNLTSASQELLPSPVQSKESMPRGALWRLLFEAGSGVMEWWPALPALARQSRELSLLWY